MFNNKLQMDAIAEAVKKVMDEAELDETGFHKAAHAAAKEGLPHFMFQGKKYKTTAKSQKEAIEIDEEQLDELSDKTLKSYLVKRSSQLIKRQMNPYANKDDTEKMRKNVVRAQDKFMKGKEPYKSTMSPGAGYYSDTYRGSNTYRSSNEDTEYTFKDKLIESLKENKATGTEELFTDNNIGEMSDAQMKRREKIVMGMKDKQADFKKKYGARWKDVMYATATKMAMNEDGDCVTPPQAKKIAKKEVKGHEKSMHHEDFDLNDFPVEEIQEFIQTEEFEQLDELSKDTLRKYAGKALSDTFRHAKGTEMRKKRISGLKMANDKLKKEEVEELDEKRGASVRGDKEKEATDSAKQVLDFVKSGGRIQTEPKKTRKPRKIMKHTDLGRTYRSGYGEDVDHDEDVLDETVDVKDKTVDMLRGRVKVSPSYDNEHKSYKVKLSSEDIIGDTGWVPKKGTQTDKSGATHTPISRAKHLAQMALQRTKKK